MVPYENFTYLTTDYGPPRFLPRVGALYDYVAFDPPDKCVGAGVHVFTCACACAPVLCELDWEHQTEPDLR